MTLRERISKFVEVLIEKLNLLQQSIPNASYSNVEQLTGGKWINGKPIYKKTFNANSITTGPSLINIASLNLEELVSIDGTTRITNSGGVVVTYALNSVKALGDSRVTSEGFLVKSAVNHNLRFALSTYNEAQDAFKYEQAYFVITLEYTKVGGVDPEPEVTDNFWRDAKIWKDIKIWKD